MEIRKELENKLCSNKKLDLAELLELKNWLDYAKEKSKLLNESPELYQAEIEYINKITWLIAQRARAQKKELQKEHLTVIK